jgi:ATP-dependent Clp protease ATP-binding subunit ClpX
MRSVRPERNDQEIVLYVRSIPLLTPREITATIREAGYVGQDRAVTAVSLMAYRHVSRLRKMHLEGISRDLLPDKTNLLLIGPTGCGKTHLVELLFQHILHLPTVIVDLTGYSETGYVGQEVTSILTRLLYAADLNQVASSVGVVCLDEFDKVASGQNNAVFAGAGSTKDVSGLGVQRELLKMLEAAEISVPNDLSHSEYGARTMMSTSDIAFIGCGAFSGFKGITDAAREADIGFGRAATSHDPERIAVSYTEDDVAAVRHFHRFGFLPELIGRFKRIVPFQSLSAEQLTDILEQNILRQYCNEFRFEEIQLEVDAAVLQFMVRQALRKESGARGLESVFARHLEDAAFAAYSEEEVKRIRLRLRDDEVVFDLD